jgi:type IV pilus assembly protein PilY1
MYVGDMQGQLWRLKFTGNSPWVDALAAVPKPIFAAKDANNNPQPITIQPEVAFAPGGGYLVAFGTGKYIENTDSSGTIISPSKTPTFPQQTLYVIYDDPATANYSVSGRGQLALRTPTVSSDRTGLTIAGADFSYGLGTNDKRGWYMDFPDSIAQGERSVSNGVLFDGQLYFNTLTMGMDACSSGGGRAYALDVVSGLASSGGVTGQLSVNGMTGSPLVLNIGDPVVDARNAIGLRQARKKSVVFAGGTSGIQPVGGSAQNQAITTGVPAGRFSWREILDWQELRIPVPATTN